MNKHCQGGIALGIVGGLIAGVLLSSALQPSQCRGHNDIVSGGLPGEAPRGGTTSLARGRGVLLPGLATRSTESESQGSPPSEPVVESLPSHLDATIASLESAIEEDPKGHIAHRILRARVESEVAFGTSEIARSLIEQFRVRMALEPWEIATLTVMVDRKDGRLDEAHAGYAVISSARDVPDDVGASSAYEDAWLFIQQGHSDTARELFGRIVQRYRESQSASAKVIVGLSKTMETSLNPAAGK